ncbi:DUF4328 domain-containing protein [Streptomyces sp. NPDC006879]|uniref:DUF4328 domain-containing protein n=1 Tax=Streptomyces sp. NPDC006879 TaxID=3364767 RepID=UPI0036B465BA
MSTSSVGPPSTAPLAPQPTGKPATTAILRSPMGLAKALAALFGLSILADLFDVFACLVGYSKLDAVLNADPSPTALDSADQAQNLIAASGHLQTAVTVALAIVFIAWFHRVRSNAEVFYPNGFDKGRGWAVGGWFVPLANLWIPYRIARETWSASTQLAPDGSRREVSTVPVTAWWTLFALYWVASRISARMYDNADTLREFRDALPPNLFTDALSIIAAVLAISFVYKLTRLQQRKVLEGPVALQA